MSSACFSSAPQDPLLCPSLHGSPAHPELATFELASSVRDFSAGPQTAGASFPRKLWGWVPPARPGSWTIGGGGSPAALASVLTPSSASPCLPAARPRARVQRRPTYHTFKYQNIIDSAIRLANKICFSPLPRQIHLHNDKTEKNI